MAYGGFRVEKNDRKAFLNPMNIYCRIMDMGLDIDSASSITRFYEKRVFDPFIKSHMYKGNGNNGRSLVHKLKKYSKALPESD